MGTKHFKQKDSNGNTQIIKDDKTNYANPDLRRAHVRFTEREYRRIFRMHLETGKSMQTLLKEAFAKGNIPKPTLNPDECKAVLNAIKAIGQKINLVTKHVNSGVTEGYEEDITEVLDDFRTLKSYLGLGDEKS
jgi:hypothetical protein